MSAARLSQTAAPSRSPRTTIPEPSLVFRRERSQNVRQTGIGLADGHESVHRRRREMINGKRVAVVLPAYNAEKTLEATVRELPALVDVRILVDDHSTDETVREATRLGLTVFRHDANYGYGRNQQTCYRE